MEIIDMRKKEDHELRKSLEEEYVNLNEHRINIKMGKEQKTNKINIMKKNIARILTVLREKEILNG